jgi:predicted acyl esterase
VPFGSLVCTPQEGVRFCSGRVPTFDRVPLDVNVTLPAQGDGNFPLVILSHGWGGSKYPLVDTGDRDNLQGSSLPWAQRGYAVLSITARGFGGSCGSVPSRAAVGCETGWIRLDDSRYEIRDVQHLAGALVDDGLVDPGRIGVHGGSYGGGVSNALAVLRNRVMQPDGTLTAWTSPKGRPISLAAAAPYIPWSDLVYSLTPNGRTLDYAAPTARESRDPKGVEKQSFVSGLFATGAANGFYSPPGVDPQSDLTSWYTRLNAGEPYEGDAQITALADEIWSHHSSISIPMDVQPAPIFSTSGWTDDLFPVDETLRLRNAILERYPSTPYALMFFDTGHQRGTGKPADLKRYQAYLGAWMDRYVKGDAAAPVLTGVETLTQTCPTDSASGGPFHAASWPEMRRGEVRLGAAGDFTVNSAAGDPDVARAIDPIAGGGNACASTSAADEAGTVNLRFPAATGQGYTLMGAPTIHATLQASGAFPQLAARLWDVAPDGNQTLVARSVFRPNGDKREVFQLHGNGWRFAAGHTAKLQLLGRDAPYARASNGAFTLTVSDIDVRLPVVERPGENPAVLAPLPYALPAGARLAPGFRGAVPIARSPRPRSSSAQRRRLYLVPGCHTVRLRGPDVRKVRRVTLFRAGMKRRTDRGIPFRVKLAGGRRASRRVRAVATLRGGRRMTVRAQLPRRCPGSRTRPAR